MLQFDFMRRTLLLSFMLSIMIPLIGIDPMIGATVVCIIGAFSIEFIRKKFPQYVDMATAIILSIGLGIAAILSDFAPGVTLLNLIYLVVFLQ